MASLVQIFKDWETSAPVDSWFKPTGGQQMAPTLEYQDTYAFLQDMHAAMEWYHVTRKSLPSRKEAAKVRLLFFFLPILVGCMKDDACRIYCAPNCHILGYRTRGKRHSSFLINS